MACEALTKVKEAGADLPSHLNIILSGGEGEGAIAFVGNPSPDMFLGAPSRSATQEIRKGTEETVRGGVSSSGNLRGMPHIVTTKSQGKKKESVSTPGTSSSPPRSTKSGTSSTRGIPTTS
ncbi:hypothetical protein ACIQU6_30435 [Streptomyces sp. NPDC090442]|uniref:hypothetical protein n=1 Tax=Streptomyces sp. NPDC090442 TaxID=3365962 RepID=UPI0038213DFC